MHLITQKALKDAAEKYPQHKTELVALGNTIAKGYFKKPESLKAVFPSLDNFKYLDKHYVFNVGGNELRVVAMVFFESQKCYIREVMTHKEGNDSNLLIVFYVQIMPDDFVMQLHRF